MFRLPSICTFAFCGSESSRSGFTYKLRLVRLKADLGFRVEVAGTALTPNVPSVCLGRLRISPLSSLCGLLRRFTVRCCYERQSNRRRLATVPTDYRNDRCETHARILSVVGTLREIAPFGLMLRVPTDAFDYWRSLAHDCEECEICLNLAYESFS
jgi:hypothetical protein